MKKIVLSIILVMLLCIMGSVYAAPSCSLNFQISKTEYSKNDEFTIDVNMANIQSERGIMSLGATLEYDKDSLTLVKMEGQNNWETPLSGISYNEANGKFVITKSGFAKSNEAVLKITFKVKEQSKTSAIITLKDITVADGTAPADVSAISKSITIKEGTQIPTPTPDPEPNPNPNPNPTPNPTPNPDNNQVNTNTTTNTVGNTTSNNISNTQNNVTADAIPNGSLPKTGDMSTKIIMVIALAIVVLMVIAIRLRIINKD